MSFRSAWSVRPVPPLVLVISGLPPLGECCSLEKETPCTGARRTKRAPVRTREPASRAGASRQSHCQRRRSGHMSAGAPRLLWDWQCLNTNSATGLIYAKPIPGRRHPLAMNTARNSFSWGLVGKSPDAAAESALLFGLRATAGERSGDRLDAGARPWKRDRGGQAWSTAPWVRKARPPAPLGLPPTSAAPRGRGKEKGNPARLSYPRAPPAYRRTRGGHDFLRQALCTPAWVKFMHGPFSGSAMPGIIPGDFGTRIGAIRRCSQVDWRCAQVPPEAGGWSLFFVDEP